MKYFVLSCVVRNTQILANVVVAFEESNQWQQQIKDDKSIRNEQAQQYLKSNTFLRY